VKGPDSLPKANAGTITRCRRGFRPQVRGAGKTCRAGRARVDRFASRPRRWKNVSGWPCPRWPVRIPASALPLAMRYHRQPYQPFLRW